MKPILLLRLPISLFIWVIIVAGCNNKSNEAASATSDASEQSTDLAQIKSGIENANARLVTIINESDSVAFADSYTPDAKIMAPGSSAISGKDNFRAFLHGLAEMGIKDFRLTTIDVWGTNELAGEEGIWSLYDNTGAEIDHGKYIVLWKQADGQWKLFRDCWNSDVPPKPAN